jgi:hypothetical protein
VPSVTDGLCGDDWLAWFGAVVGRYLGSAGGMSPDAGATQFTGPVDHAFLERGAREVHIEELLWPAWQAVITAAGTADDTARSRLVELVGAIRGRGVLVRPDGQECLVWDMRAHVDLPVFAAQLRHTWNFPPPAVSAPWWANVNAFTAQLTAAGLDFSLYAIWALRDALEEGDGHQLARVLPAAVAWLRHAGPVLASMAVERRAEGYGRDRPGTLCQQAGLTDRGFTIGRWNFWRRRLEDIAAAGGEHADKAREGLQYMLTSGQADNRLTA